MRLTFGAKLGQTPGVRLPGAGDQTLSFDLLGGGLGLLLGVSQSDFLMIDPSSAGPESRHQKKDDHYRRRHARRQPGHRAQKHVPHG